MCENRMCFWYIVIWYIVIMLREHTSGIDSKQAGGEKECQHLTN